MENRDSVLTLSQKFEILYKLFAGQSSNMLLDEWEPQEIKATRQFIWEKMIEIGIIVQGKDFSIAETNKKLKQLSDSFKTSEESISSGENESAVPNPRGMNHTKLKNDKSGFLMNLT